MENLEGGISIVAGTDGSTAASAAVARAGELAKLLRATGVRHHASCNALIVRTT